MSNTTLTVLPRGRTTEQETAYRDVFYDGAKLHNTAGCITSISYQASNSGLTWNSQYQLTAVATNGVECERNGFDALGRRVWNASTSSEGAWQTNFFVYDGNQIVADVDATGGLRRAYVWGPGIDNLLSMTSYTGGVTKTYFAITDQQRSVHAMADETGTIVESYRFDAWGRILGVCNGSGQPLTQSAIGNRYLWQGKEYSWKTGLYYNRARWYDPVTGRFISKDPAGITFGLNEYTYCGNNPVNFRDSSGLCTEKQGYWGLVGNGLNNTVDAIAQAMGIGLYDLTHWQFSQNEYERLYDRMYSTQTPVAPNATPYVATSLGISGAAATTAVAVPAARTVAANLRVDGPAVRGGRICQLRWGGTPLLRLDYHPIPGSSGTPVLHLNVGPGQGDESIHIQIWPRQ